jgi:alpha-ketoglutarate-dependent taurine dioxygenase
MTTTQVGTKLGIRKITARIGLFIGDFAQRIVGLAKGESYEFLKILQRYVTRPENILRVTWEPGQLVLFDNRITQHYAVDNYDDAPRRLHRVTVAGDIPVGIDGSPSYSVKGDASQYSPVAAIQAAA